MRAAAVQLNAKSDKAANLEKADRLVRSAAADGADLVVLPEKWTTFGTGDDFRAAAEPIGGEASTWASGVARELGIDLVAGSISEHVDGEDKLRNTSLHYGPDGELKAAYRKIHMFDVEVDGVVYRESDNEEPGDEAVLTETADGVEIGLTVCYDLRFPELFRLLAVDGARILTVPAAFTVPTTRDHWEPLVRARAIENQAFVIAANQIGEHPPSHRSGRALDDRRPVGHRARGRARTPRPSSRPTSTSRARPPSAGGCRRWPTAGRPPTAAPPPPPPPDGDRAHPDRRGRQAPPDPRRRGARVRPARLQRLPRVGHRRRGERRLRPRLPLLPLEGRGARHALPRALERHARGHPRARRAGDRRPREAPRDHVVHRRLLPPRPGADEGHHRRGHPGGELVRAAPTSRRSARPTSSSAGSSSARRRTASSARR